MVSIITPVGAVALYQCTRSAWYRQGRNLGDNVRNLGDNVRFAIEINAFEGYDVPYEKETRNQRTPLCE
ncbi:hypothetical protein [uncultured Sphaerochaeta sp.]|jgi:hypothetical protein|uniref:hypothetical protein n=1 Tax=uncultured Sphaerochaeta sp. TaxID=886478 RepID=UPI002609F2BE|nr:hypothetical protein [uncultured Sphaerochaeta sp.]